MGGSRFFIGLPLPEVARRPPPPPSSPLPRYSAALDTSRIWAHAAAAQVDSFQYQSTTCSASAYAKAVVAAAPTNYWRLNEAATATTVASCSYYATVGTYLQVTDCT